MGLVLRDALRRLCVKIGWSYAVFWRTVGLQEQRYLIWEDGYCGGKPGGMSGFEAMDLLIREKGLRASRGDERLPELGRPAEDRIYTLVHKRMASQVHVEGNGVVGKVAMTGVHEWILHGDPEHNCSASKDMGQMNQQFLAGIHTIAVIPVLPHGVLQLGSAQLICEESGFVNYVLQLFMQSGSMTRTNLCDASDTLLNHKLQWTDSMQSSVSQCGFRRRDIQLFGGHDFTFASKPSEQMPINNDISRKWALPFSNLLQSSCHVRNANFYHYNKLKSEYGCPGTVAASMEKISPHQPAHVNRVLTPDHLKSLENQFKIYHMTTHESADSPEATVDRSKSLHLSTPGNKLFNSVNDCGKTSSSGRSGSLNKGENSRDIAKFSNGIKECIKTTYFNNNSEISQFLSPTVDFDSILMLSDGCSSTHEKNSMSLFSLGKENHGSEICEVPLTEVDVHGSGNRLEHSFNPDGWWNNSNFTHINKHGCNGSHTLANCQNSVSCHNTKMLPSYIEITSDPHQSKFERTLFDLFDLEQSSNSNHRFLDDSFVSLNSMGVCELTTHVPTCISQTDVVTFGDMSNDEISCNGGLFSESGSDQLLDAIVSQVKPTCNLISDDNTSYNTASAKMSNISLHNGNRECDTSALSEPLPENFGSPSSQIACASSNKSECSIGKSEPAGSLRADKYKYQVRQWVGKAKSLNDDGISNGNCKGVDETSILNRKRFRTGENPRPRPKDRQMIQDRVKELREIVPNGAKMSIDTLLEKAIKHMLFLQSVAKHADKLKDTRKPKIISDDEGLFLKDNFEGGATWAFEVGSRSVICPIVVEDLSTPRHMLVEMLCDRKGFFLEIADSIRALGLTILKGVMESRDDKVWARFVVEANRDVTRMEVFLYLVHLLEPTAGKSILEGIQNCKNLNQSSIPLSGSADCT